MATRDQTRLAPDNRTRIPLEEAVSTVAYKGGFTGNQADFASIDDRTWERMCEAASQDHLEMEGVLQTDLYTPSLTPSVKIDPLLFGQTDGSDSPERPVILPENKLLWETGSLATCIIYHNVHVARASLERWLDPPTIRQATSVESAREAIAAVYGGWETLYSDTSRPFARPESGRIAVKVINHFGDEVLKVIGV